MLRCLCYTPKTALSGGQQQLLVAKLSPTAAAGGEDDLTLQQDSAEGAAATDSMHSELTLRQSGSLGSLEGERGVPCLLGCTRSLECGLVCSPQLLSCCML